MPLTRFLLLFLVSLSLSSELFAWRKNQIVEGTLTDSITNEPIAGVQVQFHCHVDSKQYSATSNDSGKYRMPDDLLTESSDKKYYKYRITLTKDYHITRTEEVTVPYRKDTSVIFNYSLDRSYVETTVQGTLTDEGGPIPGAKVSVSNPVTKQDLSGITSTEGTYSISGIKAHEDPERPIEVGVTLEADHHINQKLTGKLLASGLSLVATLKRDLRQQAVQGVVKDAATQQPLGDATLTFTPKDRGEKVEVNSDAKGAFMLPKGLLTDIHPQRGYVYKIDLFREAYLAGTATVTATYGSKALNLDLTIAKAPLAPPKITSPRNRVLTLRPSISIELPEAETKRASQVEVQIFEKDEKEARVDLKLKDPSFDQNHRVETTLTKADALRDDRSYQLKIRYLTSDGFTSLWAEMSFAIPSSESLSPPFSEKKVKADEFTNTQPAWMNLDGQSYVVFASNQGEFGPGPFRLWRGKSGSSSYSPLTRDIQECQHLYPATRSGGDFILFASDRIDAMNLWSVPMQGARLYTQRTSYTRGSISHPSLSSDGTLITFSRSTRQPKEGQENRILDTIWMMNSDGNNLTRLCQGTMPRFSPSGKFLLFVSDQTGNREIWRIGIDGTNPVQLTNSIEAENNPSWLDENNIVYDSPKAGNLDLWCFNLKNGKVQQLTNNLADDYMPACSEDGQVAFVSDREGGADLYAMDVSSILQGASTSRLSK
jgi:hypothetical protein